MTNEEVIELAETLNALGLERGMNWNWSIFPTRVDAEIFDKVIHTGGRDTRGVYTVDDTYHVGWR